jgi:hypothetical protein
MEPDHPFASATTKVERASTLGQERFKGRIEWVEGKQFRGFPEQVPVYRRQ